MSKRGFASDNNAGVHPSIMKALEEANNGHTIAYGNDPYTKKAVQSLQNIFGPESSVYLVFNGTAANVLGLSMLTRPFNAIICAETAHINVDECGAPEKFSGCKLLSIETHNGKISIEKIKKYMHGFGDEHHSQPKLLSISQTTEMGTVYTPDEIRTLADFTHNNNMKLHMDGARIGNAAASLGLGFKEFTADVGVDVLSFGGTKNGMMYGEAVIFFNNSLSEDFKFLRKQGMQLASKMRFIAAQFSAYLADDLWMKNASHANKMAKLLFESVKEINGVKITQEVQANGVFAIIPPEIIPELQKEYFFYVWDDIKSEVRWMTSFDTTVEDIEGFTSKLRDLLSK